MDINQITEELDVLFAQEKISEIPQFLESHIAQAVKEGAQDVLLTLYNEIIGFYRETGQYALSIENCHKAVKLMNEMGIQDTIPYATTLLNIANAHRAAGLLQESLELYNRVRPIYVALLSEDDMYFANFYNNLSLLYQEMADFASAKDQLVNALAIVSHKPDKQFEAAVTQANLANTCIELGQDDEARARAEEAIRSFEELGVDDAHYSAALSALGSLYYMDKDYPSALNAMEKSRECVAKYLGTDNIQYQRLSENIEIIQDKMKTSQNQAAAENKESGTTAEEYAPEMSEAEPPLAELSEMESPTEEPSEQGAWTEAPTAKMPVIDQAVLDEALKQLFETGIEEEESPEQSETALERASELPSEEHEREESPEQSETALQDTFELSTSEREEEIRLPETAYEEAEQPTAERKEVLDEVLSEEPAEFEQYIEAEKAIEKALSEESAEFEQYVEAEKVLEEAQSEESAEFEQYVEVEKVLEEAISEESAESEQYVEAEEVLEEAPSEESAESEQYVEAEEVLEEAPSEESAESEQHIEAEEGLDEDLAAVSELKNEHEDLSAPEGYNELTGDIMAPERLTGLYSPESSGQERSMTDTADTSAPAGQEVSVLHGSGQEAAMEDATELPDLGNSSLEASVDVPAEDIADQFEDLTPPITGLELCRRYYEEYGRPMIAGKFQAYESRIAVGLVGKGSDCFGYDDILSQDHDFGPRFVMWITRKVYDEIGEELQDAYEKLPSQFMGVDRIETFHGKDRAGVLVIEEFYKNLLGFDLVGMLAHNNGDTTSGKESLDTIKCWLSVQEYALAAAVNGEVFRDDEGIFTQYRNMLSAYYPKAVWYRKIAQTCALFSQSGQYNLPRMRRRGQLVSAELAKAECAKQAMKLYYLLNRKYAPHDKWLYRGMPQNPQMTLGEDGMENLSVPELVEKISLLPADKRHETALTTAVESLAVIFANELEKQNMVGKCDLYLDACTKELMTKSDALLTAIVANTPVVTALALSIAKSEFEAFDKVQNEGGRASCQNNWPTFKVMRMSQYMTWTEDMLLQYLYEFKTNYANGRNMIEEKYARMMESTAPLEYARFADQLPAVSDAKRAIVEQIVALQVKWMEEFAVAYPNLAEEARTIHTAEDLPYDTSYETYLRGELCTYSDRMLEMYGRYIVAHAQEGRNVAREIMENTVQFYGYQDLETANAKSTL